LPQRNVTTSSQLHKIAFLPVRGADFFQVDREIGFSWVRGRSGLLILKPSVEDHGISSVEVPAQGAVAKGCQPFLWEGKMVNIIFGIDERYCLSDSDWERIEPLLPKPKHKVVSGRPPMDNRKAMTAVLYVLRTGCQWKALPRSLGAASTVHLRFRQWVEANVFKKMWKAGLLEMEEKKELDWTWQCMDGAMTKAPLGGEKTGKNPTDRAKSGDQA
jgi:transposase